MTIVLTFVPVDQHPVNHIRTRDAKADTASGRYRDTAGNERKLCCDDARGDRAVCILNRAEITFDELATDVQGRRIDPFDITRRMQHHRRAGNDDDADNDRRRRPRQRRSTAARCAGCLVRSWPRGSAHGAARQENAEVDGEPEDQQECDRQSHIVQMRRAAHPSTPAADPSSFTESATFCGRSAADGSPYIAIVLPPRMGLSFLLGDRHNS